MKKWFQKFLKSIEDANKKNFGKGKMDCHDMNQDECPKPRNTKPKTKEKKNGGN